MGEHTPNLSPIDVAAWCRLVESSNPASLLVVIRCKMSARLQRAHAPEDVLQESLLRAWRDHANATFDSAPAFRAWLLAIVDHRIRDLADHEGAMKRGSGRAPAPMDELPEPSGSTTPSRLAIFREQAGAMLEALESVPVECRDVVRLRLFHQMPLAQIAEELRLGIGAVRCRFREGASIYRERLRAALISRSCPPASHFAAPAPRDSASEV